MIDGVLGQSEVSTRVCVRGAIESVIKTFILKITRIVFNLFNTILI
jgi:hypothetical protein